MKILYAIIVLLLLSACNKSELPDNVKTSKSGFKYNIISAEKPGKKLLPNNVVKLHITQYIDDSLTQSTYNKLPEYIKLDSTLREYDYTEILPFMAVQDSAICYFPVKDVIKRSNIKGKVPDILAKANMVRVHIKILEVFTSDSIAFANRKMELEEIEHKEEELREAMAPIEFDSLINALPPGVNKLENGVVVHTTYKHPTCEKIRLGDTIQINYKAYLGDGTPVDSSSTKKPFKLTGKEKLAITCFYTSIATICKKDKARIYIPAHLGYGSIGNLSNIPPHSNLIFDVEPY